MTGPMPPAAGQPPRPPGPRPTGDAWVDGPHGRFWGRFGAAGILVHDVDRGILLQHRAIWSDQGGTWGLPGGALHQGEDAVSGALREACEEAAVPADHLQVLFTSVFDVAYWSYTTVGARITKPFEARIGDPESIELQWVQPDAVESKQLHRGFAAAWPALRASLARRLYLVVDGANVVGSRPNGWWRDRRKAAQDLIDRLHVLTDDGVPSEAAGLERVWPQIVFVTEGRANGAVDPLNKVQVVAAEGDGDEAIVGTVRRLRREGSSVQVVTADRELQRRVSELGAGTEGPAWLLRQIETD